MLSQQFKPDRDELARSGILIGTSSWKYPGWCGQFYDEQWYLTRGKFSEAKFERECLTKSAKTFVPLGVEVSDVDFSETIAHLQKAVSHMACWHPESGQHALCMKVALPLRDDVRVITCASPALIWRATMAASLRASPSLEKFRRCRVPATNHVSMKIVFFRLRTGYIFTVVELFRISMTPDFRSTAGRCSVFFTGNYCHATALQLPCIQVQGFHFHHFYL